MVEAFDLKCLVGEFTQVTSAALGGRCKVSAMAGMGLRFRPRCQRENRNASPKPEILNSRAYGSEVRSPKRGTTTQDWATT